MTLEIIEYLMSENIFKIMLGILLQRQRIVEHNNIKRISCMIKY